jgi:hypothetical protein
MVFAQVYTNNIKVHFEKEKEFQVNMMMVIDVFNRWDRTFNGVLLEDRTHNSLDTTTSSSNIYNNFKQEIVVKIERIQGKIDKISRLRDIFEAKTNSIMESLAASDTYVSGCIPTAMKNITIISGIYLSM